MKDFEHDAHTSRLYKENWHDACAKLNEQDAVIVALTAQLRASSAALRAMLTHMRIDEDEFNKPTFNQAREVLRGQHE